MNISNKEHVSLTTKNLKKFKKVDDSNLTYIEAFKQSRFMTKNSLLHKFFLTSVACCITTILVTVLCRVTANISVINTVFNILCALGTITSITVGALVFIAFLFRNAENSNLAIFKEIGFTFLMRLTVQVKREGEKATRGLLASQVLFILLELITQQIVWMIHIGR